MKKIYMAILCAALGFITSRTFAQTTPLAYEKGNQLFKIGLGLGAPFTNGSLSVPPLQAIYENGVTEEISVGGIVGYSSSSETYAELGKVSYSYLIVGGRANYHFETTDKFDPYGGITLGYNKISQSNNSEYLGDYKQSMVLYGAQIGANYYFNPKVGAWAEVGYGLGYLNLGITFKF